MGSSITEITNAINNIKDKQSSSKSQDSKSLDSYGIDIGNLEIQNKTYEIKILFWDTENHKKANTQHITISSPEESITDKWCISCLKL